MSARGLAMALVLALPAWLAVVLTGCSIVWAARNLGEWQTLLVAVSMVACAALASLAGDES